MHYKLLFIDDHSVVIEGYKSILSYMDESYSITSYSVFSFREALTFLMAHQPKVDVDVVFLDYTLPECPELNLYTGEDLIPYIKEHQPTAKIIIITSHTEHFLLFSLHKNHQPDGILIKSDFTSQEFIIAFQSIVFGKKYYSRTMLDALKRIKSPDFFLDFVDMKIIMLLHQGIKTKNLNDHLPLTISAIDKRKLKIKQFLNIEKGNDEDIIREAKKQRFI